MTIIYDPSSDFWTGYGWLVIEEEDKPAVASFKTKDEAEDYVNDNHENPE